jgi:hypothetical protein
MLLHHVLAAEFAADNNGFEMLAIAADLYIFAGQCGLNPAFDIFRGHHDIDSALI